jgi:hypothetical protein
MKQFIILTAFLAVFSVGNAQVSITCPSDKTIYTNSDAVNNYNCSTLVTAAMGVAPTLVDLYDTQVLRYEVSGASYLFGSGSVAGVTVNRGNNLVNYTLLPSNLTCNFNIYVDDIETPRTVLIPTTVYDSCDFPITLSNIPTPYDNCSGASLVLVSEVETDLGTSCATKTPLQKYTKKVIRTFEVTDERNNTAIVTQTHYTRDMIAPIAVLNSTKEVSIGNVNITYPVSNLNLGSYDGCGGNLTFRGCLGAGCTNYSMNLTLKRTMIPTGQNEVLLTVRVRAEDTCKNYSTITEVPLLLKKF